MAVAQVRLSLAQNCPARPPALPAVVHRPALQLRVVGIRVVPLCLKTFCPAILFPSPWGRRLGCGRAKKPTLISFVQLPPPGLFRAGLSSAAGVAIFCSVTRKIRERRPVQKHFGKLRLLNFGAAICLATTASAQLFTPLHIFSEATGSVAPLAQGADGTLYGVSAYGGVSGPPGYGTVFKVQPDGSGFDIIYSFTNGSDGSGPAAGLILSGNTLYGTAENGGSGGHGTVFKINTDGIGLRPDLQFHGLHTGHEQ